MAAEELPMTDLCVTLSPSEGATQQSFSKKETDQVEEVKCRKNKRPRRVLHFSDGTLEEYSTDEEEEQPHPDSMALIDPKSLTWGPWMYYWLLYSGSSALSACDYVGESLANFLGITTPKYQYEIDEYQRCIEEEKAQKEEEEAEMAGWSSPAQSTANKDDHIVPGSAIQQAPSPSHSGKQNLSEGDTKDYDKAPSPGFTTQIPTVMITSEYTPESGSPRVTPRDGEATSSPSKSGPDSESWDRF